MSTGHQTIYWTLVFGKTVLIRSEVKTYFDQPDKVPHWRRLWPGLVTTSTQRDIDWGGGNIGVFAGVRICCLPASACMGYWALYKYNRRHLQCAGTGSVSYQESHFNLKLNLAWGLEPFGWLAVAGPTYSRGGLREDWTYLHWWFWHHQWCQPDQDYQLQIFRHWKEDLCDNRVGWWHSVNLINWNH